MFSDKLKNILKLKKNNLAEENKEESQNNKKKIENIVFFIIVIIITICIINIIWDESETIEYDNAGKELAKEDISLEIENESYIEFDIEKELEEILSKIAGVGDVEVFINYSQTSEVIAMYDENITTSNTEEIDDTGGERSITETDIQKEIIYKEESGEKIPITQKIVQPKIEGAIVTAIGANDMDIKTKIIQAVEAVTGIATHKIQVFAMN